MEELESSNANKKVVDDQRVSVSCTEAFLVEKVPEIGGFEHLLIYQILEVKTTHIIISWEIPDFMAIQSSSAIGTPGNAMEVKRHLQYVLTLGSSRSVLGFKSSGKPPNQFRTFIASNMSLGVSD